MLELGSGGGNNAFHLKKEFELTLVDLSADMLAVSKALNPECEHVQGDMRSVRLGRTFDAVFVHDAIEYMTTEDDLRQAVQTVYAHCRPGGVAVLVPDDIAENFEPRPSTAATTRRTAGACGTWPGRPIRIRTTVRRSPSTRSCCARPTGRCRSRRTPTCSASSRGRPGCGCSPRPGSSPRSVAEVTSEDRLPREFFVGVRPA